MPTQTNSISILGIDFFNGNVSQAINKVLDGGLLVVPAAPALATIPDDPKYYDALLNSDIAIADSGFMVLCCKFLNGMGIKKLSGLKFLKYFFMHLSNTEMGNIFLVNPSKDEEDINLNYLSSLGITCSSEDSYVAPFYQKSEISDLELLQRIQEKRPEVILINLGGGTQERLGSYLKNHLDYKPSIICTGAAISFFTGSQARIPDWADRLYLGWLCRCISAPKTFLPRYVKGVGLLPLLLKHKTRQVEISPPKV